MISYIIPHRNRVDLLCANLKTLLAQTSDNFEVVIIDNSDELHFNHLNAVVTHFRAKGLRIKGIAIDPSRHEFSHLGGKYSRSFNPALSQNIGALRASGDILCLTSPEVINSSSNVETISNIFSDNKSKFILGWIDERSLASLGNIEDGITTERIKRVCHSPGYGAMCRDDNPARPWLPINYFLGCIRREDFIKIGGIDERFMKSIAWEDNFFAHCCDKNGFPAQFEPSIAGIHLSHSRGYQMDLNNENKDLWNFLEKSAIIANDGYEWGSDKYITRIY